MIKIENYNEAYQDQVVACLRRNSRRMYEEGKAAVLAWLEPLLTYQWAEPFDELDSKSRRGLVLLDGEKVVGCIGLIYSRNSIGDLAYTAVNLSTLVIDMPYRTYFLPLIKESVRGVDVVMNYTPIKIIEVAMKKFFHHKCIDSESYLFYPIPCHGHWLHFEFIKDAGEIKNKAVRRKYADHIPYGVKMVRAWKGGHEINIFYKIVFRKMHRINVKIIRVLETDDIDFASANAHEIIWNIQKKEKAFLESDSRFFGGQSMVYGAAFRKSKICRLAYAVRESIPIERIGLLYTEMAILDRL